MQMPSPAALAERSAPPLQFPPPRARDVASGAIIATDLRLAHTHWTRLRGLLGTKSLEPGQGLWLRPCNQVHMFGMRYAVDVVFLDDEQRVVHTVKGLRPRKISPKVRDATSVLELPSGTLARVPLRRGARIAIEGGDGKVMGPEVAGADAGTIVCNVLLAAFYLFFTIAHFRIAQRSGQWATILPVVVQEALLVVLFLTRRRSVAASTRPFDWALGIVGTFLPLLMRPTDELGPLTTFGRPLQIAGLLLAIGAVAFLGRSIGVIAANRGVQVAGPYGVVRHPIYAAYILAYLGYVLSFPSTLNCFIVALTIGALFGRAVVEERFLERDPRYRAYLGRIRWRFLPYVH